MRCTAAAIRNSVSWPLDDDEGSPNSQANHQRSEDAPEDHPNPFVQHRTASAPNITSIRFVSEVYGQTDLTNDAHHPFGSIQYIDRCQDEYTLADFDPTDIRKESVGVTLDIERQHKAALTIQESFRRKRYQRCLKRSMLADRLLFDAQLARGARRLLIHLATFAVYLASLDLSSNGLAK
jgi:hypothetical protein